jgi:hypothetical protein
MSFTFPTTVLGLDVEVTGTIEADEPENNYKGGFELEEIEYNGINLEWEDLAEEVITRICEEALSNAAEEAALFRMEAKLGL